MALDVILVNVVVVINFLIIAPISIIGLLKWLARELLSVKIIIMDWHKSFAPPFLRCYTFNIVIMFISTALIVFVFYAVYIQVGIV